MEIKRTMNRKERRKLAAAAKKVGNTDLEEKLKLVETLSSACRSCKSPFDKENMKMLSEWMIVVRESESSTHLYCPKCWEKAVKIIEKL